MKSKFHNFSATDLGGSFSCNCIGPQPGYPRCPCGMRNLIQRDGRWIQPEQDLGPAVKPEDAA
ncbi:hypothetical protein A3728_18465 [Sulfitobacter sp. HI0040]|nr:hypothetical protein A3728_18465 [Sulfitobacter sp. HI0040]KZZ68857.1 hypothetical protein A3764_12165 [Sulfitobacter sp. HI0129]